MFKAVDMRTKKAIIKAVDKMVVSIYEASRTANNEYWDGKLSGALSAAEMVHGCPVTVVGGKLYEMRRVYAPVAVMPKDNMCAKYGEHNALDNGTQLRHINSIESNQ